MESCRICKKEAEMSLEFPDYCKKCADKYGDYTELPKSPTKPKKTKMKE